MKFTIKSNHLRVVQACVAAANEKRAYLQGWHVEGSISNPEPVLVGTNGAIMTTVPIVVTEYDDRDAPSITIFRPIKISARKSESIITIDTIARTATYTAGKTVKVIELVPIEGTYPNWRKVGPDRAWEQGNGVSTIALDPMLLGLVQQALQSPAAKLSFGKDEKSMIRVSWLGEAGVNTYVMPMGY